MINHTNVDEDGRYLGQVNSDSADRPDPGLVSKRQAVKVLQGDGPMLYAMRTNDGLIKIGCSGNLAQRMYTAGVEILGFMPGDFNDEKAIHESLASFVHHGREWYHPTRQVLAVVNQM